LNLHRFLSRGEKVIRNQQVSNRADTFLARKQANQNQKPPAKTRPTGHNDKKFSFRSSISLAQIGLLSLVFVGLLTAQLLGKKNTSAASTKVLAASVQTSDVQSVDQLTASQIAATVAQEVKLPIAANVANQSDTLTAQAMMGQSNNNVALTKPQVLATSAQSGSSIEHYIVKTGDTVPELAAKFGISENTIKWANNLSSDALTPGTDLTILPTSGVLYTVKDGDTAASIASQFGSQADQIVSFNDAELNGFKTGQQIIIPDGIVKATPATTQPVITNDISVPTPNIFAPSFGGNGYAFGYCTWYVANRRAAIGRPVPNNWGNANTWAYMASLSGYGVGHQPKVGSILQTGGGWGGYGHVAFVENVNADGSIDVSEMNYAGWDVISSRHISAAQASSYNYIF
jgi:surface antigen